jgi:serine/threonine protein kinase/Tfp pilus assembly protein PilF
LRQSAQLQLEVTGLLGKTISHYEVTRALGAGAMGEVYAARDTLLGRNVAIKILQTGGGAHEESRLRFLQEARAASALNHPNIITIYDVVRDGDVDCIIMELVSGETLDERMERGLVPLQETLDILDRIADALQAAHTRGIVHRDLKPANVMLTSSGGLKVLDFGLAKLLADFDGPPQSSPVLRTQSGMVVGTPSFMSPEQALGRPLDCRSDLFSLGLIGLVMLTGHNPFEADSAVATMHRIAYGTPLSFENVPEIVVPMFKRLLARETAERYQSAEELRRTIAEIRADSGIRTMRLKMHRPSRSTPLRRRAAAALAGVLVIGIGIAGAQLWRTRASATPSAQAAQVFTPPQTAPQHVQRGNELLTTYWRKGYIDRTIEEFQRAIAIDAGHAAAHAGLANAYWLKYEREKDKSWLDLALRNARHAVELDPQLARAHVALGTAELGSGNLDTAQKELEQALVIDPANAVAHRWMSDVASRRKDESKAEAELRKAIELEPRNADLYNVLGWFFYKSARYDQSANAFRQAIALTPDYVRAYRNLGAVLHMRGDYAGAARVLQQSLEIEPDATAYSNLGTLYFFQGLYPQAVSAFEKAVQLGANRHEVWANLGDAYRWTPGNQSKAREAFSTALNLLEDEIRKNGDDPALQSRKALYLAKEGNARTALAVADPLMTPKEKNAQNLYRLALTFELAGARPKSLEALDQAIRNGYSKEEVKADPELASLRRDVQYQRMMARPQ